MKGEGEEGRDQRYWRKRSEILLRRREREESIRHNEGRERAKKEGIRDIVGRERRRKGLEIL